MAPADLFSFPTATPPAKSDPEDSNTHRLTTEVGASGDVLEPYLGRCLGPAGTWPCALPLGHGGDHERFEESDSFLLSYVAPSLKEVQRRVDRLIAERNDLLESCKQLSDRLDEIGHEDDWRVERARAVIALAEGK